MSSAVVVGAGVVGLTVARELAGRGWRVTIVDRNRPGVVGPSTAQARILRCAYGERPWYTELTWSSLRRWRALGAETGQELFVASGVLHFVSDGPGADADADWAQRSLSVLRERGVPAEQLAPAAVRSRFPAVSALGLRFAVHEPQAGVLRARQAVLALARSCRARGCRFLRGTAEPDGPEVRVGGDRHRADAVVWAPGAALPALFPGLTSARAVEQTSYFLASAAVPCGPTGPAWIDRAHAVYGVGALNGRGVKVVPDVVVPAGSAACGPALPEATRAYLRQRVPVLATAPVTATDVCAYAAMPDDEFLLTPLPDGKDVWLVGGDSGHGFKNAPAWGRYVCDAVEGKTTVHHRWGPR